MRELESYNDEIYKCSRCGLCQSVCPVFKATLNECAVSRGKFNILNGIVKGDLRLTKNVKKYLDLCTGCNACKDFCPSQIDSKKIFLAAKAKFYKENKLSFWDKVLNSYVLFLILLNCARVFFSISRVLHLELLIKICTPMILCFGVLGKRILLLPNLIAKKRFKINYKKSSLKNKTAIYFEGCFNKYLNSETKDAVLKILSFTDIKIIKKNFECCGVSYYNDGNIKNFKKIIDKNLSKLDINYDYLITDCASCCDVLSKYCEFSDSINAKNIANKVVMVTDLLKKIRFDCNSNMRVSVHKPCHENDNIIDFVKNINNINFVNIDGYDTCCGFSGKFALQNDEISREISKQKTKKYLDANVDIILTTCPACILGLEQGLIENNSQHKIKVMNLFVFLAQYCQIGA